MMEYTFLAVFSVALAVIADRYSKVELLLRPIYWVFLLIIIGFKLMVNGYLTGSNIVVYGPFYLGVRIGSIPIEDFLFGFSMVTIGILVYETNKKK